MNYNEIFEATVDNMKNGYKPHIRLKRSIAMRMKKNWRGLTHSDLLDMFPEAMNKLSNIGVNSKGRELYDKTLLGTKIVNNYQEALVAKELYQEAINNLS